MKRTLVGALVLVLSATAPVIAQQTLPPLRIGTHVAGNMMNGPFDMYRLGGQLVIPVGMRLALYPSVSRYLDGARWELSAALRYRPFGSREGSSPLYLGFGLAGIRWQTQGLGYDLWIAGLEVPNGRFRPYVELQFLGPVLQIIDSHDWGVQAHAGITWAVR